MDSGAVFIYLFDSSSGKLIQVGAYAHNVTLDLYYSGSNQLQYIENSESGRKLQVNYTDSNLIRSIELLDADENVEKTT